MHGLTSNSLFVLYMLRKYPNQCTQHFICEKLYYPKQTVNAIFNTFIHLGYVEKVISKDDKRSKILSFTEVGEKYADEILNKLHQFEEEALLNMKEDERISMINTNHIFYEQLKNVLDLEEQLYCSIKKDNERG